jgi:hypothetical protein
LLRSAAQLTALRPTQSAPSASFVERLRERVTAEALSVEGGE